MKDQIYLYPIWIRLWHLVNAIMCLTLIFTGLCLQYSSADFILIPFEYAVLIHNITGIILAISYFLYLFGNRFTSNGSYYQFPIKGMITRVIKQFKYYSIGIFKKEKAPYPISITRKFNPLQKLSYVIVMYFIMPIIVISGIALFFPDFLPDKILNFSGIHFIDLVHIIGGFVLTVFLVVHVYFCTIGKTNISNFKSMINGWH